MSDHFIGKVALKAIIEKDGKIFISRDPREPDTWEIPGGRMHIGESVEEGLKRELREELGVEVSVGPLVYSAQFLHSMDQQWCLLLTHIVRLEQPETDMKFDPAEIEETRWITPGELHNQKIFPVLLDAIKAYWKL